MAGEAYEFLTHDTLDDGLIARVTLNRPRTRNAQNRGLLVELDRVLMELESDDAVRVVILCGAGPMFSSGHDLVEALAQQVPDEARHPSFASKGGTRRATEQRLLQEWHHYFQNTRRWRDLRKITIAQVHGQVLAAGLMLAWACDLIVAAEGTLFADPVGVRLGMCGVEYFAHPWELGLRRAKMLMLTGDAIDAEEAFRIGMVSKVFPEAELAEQTLELARTIAARPSITSLLIKESVNQTQDIMGFQNALTACFSLHHINHAHWAETRGGAITAGPEDGAVDWRSAAPVSPKAKDRV